MPSTAGSTDATPADAMTGHAPDMSGARRTNPVMPTTSRAVATRDDRVPQHVQTPYFPGRPVW